MTTVLTISYGRQLFAAENAERTRLRACAEVVAALHMIVFSRAQHCLSAVADGPLALHPTSARTRIGMLVSAYRIGSALLAAAPDRRDWIISAQDPFEAGLIGFLLARRYGVPLQIQEHGDFFGTPHWRRERIGNRLRAYLGTWLLRWASCVRTVSQRARTHLVARGVAPERIATTPVAVELAPFLAVGTARSERGGETEARATNEPTILFVGRLVAQKDLELLIRAFVRARTQGALARLVIVGSGPEEARLKTCASSLGVGEHISFVPWTDDVPALMRDADIFALSSRYEGWGRVILEAMAAGLPGVITEVGCAGEVFLDDEHGFVVPVGDEEAFAAALTRLIRDASLRRQYGERAVADVQAYSAAQPPYPEAWRDAFAPCLRSGAEKR